MNWASSQVLVTGGGGFLGSHLCEALLARGAKKISVFGHLSESNRKNLSSIEKEIEIIQGDIEHDQGLLATLAKRSDLIFHLAGVANPNDCSAKPEKTHSINVTATQQLIDTIENCQRFLFFSSSLLYGEPDYLPIDEQHPLKGSGPYSLQKKDAESLCQEAFQDRGLPITIIRNFNIYGPRQQESYIVPHFITQALTQKGAEIWDPKPVRDFTYVGDAVDAFIRIAETPSLIGEIVNLGSGEPISIGDLAKTLSNMMGVPVCFLNLERAGSTKLICNRKKLSEATGWKPTTPLFAGLQQTLQYFKNATKT